MTEPGPRLRREAATITAMLELYCSDQHSAARTGAELCEDCAGLLRYAHERLHRCPFGEGKTTCVKCPIHCYKPDMRERVRQVMRFAGPRMLYHHPVLAVRHLWDDRRDTPVGRVARQSGK